MVKKSKIFWKPVKELDLFPRFLELSDRLKKQGFEETPESGTIGSMLYRDGILIPLIFKAKNDNEIYILDEGSVYYVFKRNKNFYEDYLEDIKDELTIVFNAIKQISPGANYVMPLHLGELTEKEVLAFNKKGLKISPVPGSRGKTQYIDRFSFLKQVVNQYDPSVKVF